MNYPKSIYRKYEIVEKFICGEVYYGLVRVYSLLGMVIKLHKPVCSRDNYSGYFGGMCPRKWWSNKSVITSCIENDNYHREWAFGRKMTK